MPILTCVFFALNWLTLTPKTHFVQFYLIFSSYFLSWGQKYVCDTGDEAVMKKHKKIKTGIYWKSIFFFRFQSIINLKLKFWGLIYGVLFDTKKCFRLRPGGWECNGNILHLLEKINAKFKSCKCGMESIHASITIICTEVEMWTDVVHKIYLFFILVR